MFKKQIVGLLVSAGIIFSICIPVTAGNTEIHMLTVSVQVLDKKSAYMTAVRSTPIMEGVNTYTRVQEGRIIANYSIDNSIIIERGKNITITGKIENPLLNGDFLFVRPVASVIGPNDIPLSTSEQVLIATPAKGVGNISNTYPFHYSFSTACDVLEEIQHTRPIIVVLTVYY